MNLHQAKGKVLYILVCEAYSPTSHRHLYWYREEKQSYNEANTQNKRELLEAPSPFKDIIRLLIISAQHLLHEIINFLIVEAWLSQGFVTHSQKHPTYDNTNNDKPHILSRTSLIECEHI